MQHNPPAYSGAQNIPSRLQLVVGEEYKINTGLPSEDAVSAEFKVVADKDLWRDFIKVTLNSETLSMDLDIAPTLTEMIGQYILAIELTDSGCDSLDCPTDDYLCLPITTAYKISLFVVGEEGNELDLGLDNSGNESPSVMTDCDLSSGITRCNPSMELKELNFFGEATFAFDHPMAIPSNFSNWGGSNHYFKTAFSTGPLDLTVFPGYDQNASKL